MESCCCDKKKVRTVEESNKLNNRLNRIEGQVRGIKEMLSRDAYCTDIIMQVAAVKAALDSFTKEILDTHIHTCVVEDVKAGNDEKVNELVEMLKKLMR